MQNMKLSDSSKEASREFFGSGYGKELLSFLETNAPPVLIEGKDLSIEETAIRGARLQGWLDIINVIKTEIGE